MSSSNRKFPVKLVAAIVLAIGLVVFLVSYKGVSFQAVQEALKAFRWPVVLSAFAFVLLQNSFIVLRLWALLPARSGLSLFDVAHGVVYGQLLNTFVPARAGDVLKAVIFKKAGNSNVNLMTGAGVIVADKLIDMAALVCLIFLSGAYAVPELVWVPQIPAWTLATVPVVLILIFLIVRFFLAEKLRGAVTWWINFRDGLRGLVRPRQLITALFIGFGAWTFEAAALQILTADQGMVIGFDRAVFLLCLLNLAIAVPISLANVGTFEASLVFGLSTFGVSTAVGLAIATVHHSLQLAGIIFLSGLVALVRALKPKPQQSLSGEFRVQLEDKQKAIDYFESVSKDYDGTVSKGILKIPRDLERAVVLKYAKLDQPGASLIDVGCGAGYYSLEAKKAGMEVWAVDASPGMVLRLQNKVDFTEVVDIETMEFDKKFDRVVCAGVLDFVLNPDKAFRNLCKLVAPGGRLIVLSPRKGLGGLFYRVEKHFFGIHINLFTLKWLRTIAEENGLVLRAHEHPLPTNMAVLFERPVEGSPV